MSYASYARPAAPTLVQFGGRRYLVEPPTVDQVMQIMGGAELSVERLVNDRLVRQALRDWWPLKMASAATAPRRELGPALGLVRKLILSRTEQEREAVAEDQGEEDPADIDWPAVVADYMACYGLSRRAVGREAWPAFLQAAAHLRRQHAQWGLMYLRAKSIPYVEDDAERNQRIDELREEAGRERSDSEGAAARRREEKKEQSARAFAALRSQMQPPPVPPPEA